MHAVQFTMEEKTLLASCFELRKTYLLEQPKFHKKYLNLITSVFAKFETGNEIRLTLWEKLSCCSCVNDHREDLQSAVSINTAYDWVTVTKNRYEILKEIDLCLDILAKCGYFRRSTRRFEGNARFRYRNIFALIDKLRNTESIYIRKESGKIKRIGFVNKDGMLSFYLNEKIDFKQVEFRTLDEAQVTDRIKKYFDTVILRAAALEILETYDYLDYPAGTIAVLINLISST